MPRTTPSDPVFRRPGAGEGLRAHTRAGPAAGDAEKVYLSGTWGSLEAANSRVYAPGIDRNGRHAALRDALTGPSIAIQLAIGVAIDGAHTAFAYLDAIR